MKKNILKKAMVILTASILTLAMVGCGSKKEESQPEETATTEATVEETIEETIEDTIEETEEASAEVAGGWTVNTEIEPCAMDEDALAAFDKAVEGYTGVGLEPEAVLGTQVVAGTNYAFLCKQTTVTADPVTTLSVAIVYADLDGNAEIINVKDINIADYTEEGSVEFDVEGVAGGWTVSNDLEGKLSEEVQEKFDKAMEGLMGVNYIPVAELGTQVVAGENIAILCRAELVSDDPVSALAVVTIYADLDGGASVLGIAPFDLADYNE